MNKSRTSYKWLSLIAAGMLAFAVAGCSDDDNGGSAAPPPTTGGGGGVTPPTGTSPVDVTKLTADQWAALTPVVKVGSVSISSPPVVSFSIADANNNPVIGIGYTNKTSTATVASLAHLRFSLAKLVPGASGSPSKWVNYLVTSVPTTTAAAAPTRPTTDQQGTLVDNKNGTYTYTFYRDVPKIKEQLAAMSVTSPNDKAALGDVTYEPNLQHRLTIQLSGNARGTGTNTPDGSNSGVTAVPIENPVNAIFDFVPATGKVLAANELTREVVAIENCNECHQKLTLHGSRIETKYCVVCHTDQLKYGFANVTSTSGKFPAVTETATVDPVTGITSYRYSPNMFLADGESLGDFPIMVHKIHQGKELVKGTYNLANVVFNNKGFSMLGGGQKMCTKCHDSGKAAQANNYKAAPSRLACGACHDGINWATGSGSTLADKAAFDAAKTTTTTMATSGHVGGRQSNDATCALCHGAADIVVYHQTENVTPHNPTIAAGLVNFTYEIASADVDSANALKVKFRINADGKPVTFVPAAASVSNPLTGFTGGPSFMLPYALSQDGVTTPVDYNNLGRSNAQPRTVSIASLLSTGSTSTGSLSAQDSSGYYTATINSASAFPAGAKLRAVALQGYFTQITAPASATAGIGRHTISVVKSVTGDAVRRTVVDKEKCANCHEWFEGHGGNRVKETQVCVGCHVPGISTSGRQIADSTMNTWVFNNSQQKIIDEWKTVYGFDPKATNAALKLPVITNNFKDMIHGIHSGRERVTPFTDARDSTSRGEVTVLDFRRMDFPGVLNNCDTCHVTGSYSGVPLNTLASTYEANNGAVATPADVAKSLASTPNASDIVTTPFAAACVSCHDSNSAQAHMKTQGGQVKVARSALILTGEACAVCHGAGKELDPAKVHK